MRCGRGAIAAPQIALFAFDEELIRERRIPETPLLLLKQTERDTGVQQPVCGARMDLQPPRNLFARLSRPCQHRREAELDEREKNFGALVRSSKIKQYAG